MSTLRFVLITGLIWATVSGNAVAADKETAAVAAAGACLGMVDGGQYDESWKNAAELFKAAISQGQWAQTIKAVRGPLGELVTRKVKQASYKTSLPGVPDGEYVVIQFETTFKNKSAAVETVTPMKDADGQWRVSGYYIK